MAADVSKIFLDIAFSSAIRLDVISLEHGKESFQLSFPELFLAKSFYSCRYRIDSLWPELNVDNLILYWYVASKDFS